MEDRGPGPEFARGGPRAATLVAWLLVPAILGGLVFEQARRFREATCETFDEFIYLRLGVRLSRYGDFASLASPMSPPLPILLEYGLPTARARSLPESEGWEREVPGLVRQARLLTSITAGIPLSWAAYAWLARRRGWIVGALSGALVALSPTVLAAASVATTDACFALFAVLALAALHRYQVRPSRRSFVMAGVAMGLALAAKQTALFLFPVALMELLLMSPGRRPGSTRVDACLRALSRAGTRLAAWAAIVFAVDWALYGFASAPPFRSGAVHAGLPVVVPMIASLFPNGDTIMDVVGWMRPPLALDTLAGQIDHSRQGHAAFLMGQHSFRGWWYFFPVAIALKSTPAELLMFGLAACLAALPRSWADPARRLWLGSLLVLLAIGMSSALNIGHRYMLLAYPLAILLAVDMLGEIQARRPVRFAAGAALLLAWQAASAIGISPHYLSYFNGLCGGPSQGYRYLVDSSLDWGQDLPALRRELEARGYSRVALAYFGTASPRVYGLRSMGHLEPEDPVASGCDWLAISATALQGVYGGPDLTDHFVSLPSVRVAYSIFLYDLKDPRVRTALDAVRRPLHAGTKITDVPKEGRSSVK